MNAAAEIEPKTATEGLGVTQVGWQAQAALDFATWRQYGHRFGMLGRAVPWLIGDWINYGEAAYGERYTEAVEITGLEVGTLMNFAWVAGRFELSRRRENLSWSHHYEVAALAPADADRLLDDAEDEGWSRNRLRAQVRRERAAQEGTKQPVLWPANRDRPEAPRELRATLQVTAELQSRREFSRRVAALTERARELGLRLAEPTVEA